MGQPWQQAEKDTWFREQEIRRSYQDEVVAKIRALSRTFELVQYGALSQDPARYPLFLLRSKSFAPAKETILVTGGVHGYETSGVQGALAFLENVAPGYERNFNFVCAPCVSPWAYETINRWNAAAIDPNRSFREDSPAEECRHFLKAMKGLEPFAHFDLHETTDTDKTVFRPALEARDGLEPEELGIPDGFYVVGDAENPQPAFQAAIIEAVRKVTHIAPADANGCLIGDKVEQEGVIHYPLKKLFLCAGFSGARYTCTTEVYPDSPRATPRICIEAQVAAVRGGIDYLLAQCGGA
jgi:hypothetical protein